MLMSRKHNFIFIHIYKNAGTSITSALKPYAGNIFHRNLGRFLHKLDIPTDLDIHPFYDHVKAHEIIEKIGEEEFKSYFTFAIVRNPWDWQVSLYKYMLKEKTHYQHNLIRSLGSFDEYIKWRCGNEVEFQKDFIYSNNNKILVDFVGRMENLDHDFKTICSRIGITASLPKLNVSNTKPYQQYYTDETIDLVGITYKPDIDCFNYEFE